MALRLSLFNCVGNGCQCRDTMPKLNKTIDTDYDFHFPKAGLYKADAFGRQPVFQINGEYCRTTPLAQNVRTYDVRTRRNRGGSRPGMTKLISTQVNGDWVVQELRTITVGSQMGSGSVQTSLSGRVVILLGVSNGVVKVQNPGDTVWTAVTNNTGEEPALNISGPMMSAQNSQKLWIVDGVNYVVYHPVTNSLEAWTASAGSMPEDSDGNFARLICNWFGRIVVAGLPLDPQNYFMSAVNDPTDFNELPPAPVPVTAATSGNNADAGLIGDVITGLIPWSNDVLVFLCDHMIFKMTGNPLDGGVVDKVSESIGGAWGEAWCMDPDGNIYFLSNHCGVYIMEAPNGKPRFLSQAIEKLTQDINTGECIIRMQWNNQEKGFYLFVTFMDAPAATRHYFYDVRNNAWFPDVFGNLDHNPLCCCTFDGNEPDDRKLLIGCWDGYVRQFDPDADDDDGTDIDSVVIIGPILTATADMMMLNELQAILAEMSDDVTWSVKVGDTAESALSSTAVRSGTWVAGRNRNSPVRRSGHAIYIRIASTNQWALESIRAMFGPTGKITRRSNTKP